MDGKYLLDSSVIIDIFKQIPATLNRIQNAKQIFLPATALGELYFGAYKSSRFDKHFVEVKDLVGNGNVIKCDEETAKVYGRIKYQLKVNGTPIPENDIWIAAIAIQYGLTLANRDKHFDLISELKQEKW
ncbi:MAG: type II toxin-antitoxin system VapC family toxin [Saprospiraceae bacterium]